MAFFQEELGWFAKLGRLASSVSNRAQKCEVRREENSLDATEWKSFDLADVMEAGQARELTTSFMAAPPREQASSYLIVERSKDRSKHMLKTEAGEPLLLAMRDKEDCGTINFYVPTSGDPPVALGPAFQLMAQDDEMTTWSLSTDRCECCAYMPKARTSCTRASEGCCRQELMHVRQTREDFGPCSMMTMEVELPSLRPDGVPDAACEHSEGLERSPRLRLESRRPRWNKRLNSLILDFHGRCSKASVQNFQLDWVSGEEDVETVKQGEPEILFGRTGNDEFVLDYKHPLGMAQAFAIALTTNVWQ
jgi:hypothetical protein